MPNDTLFYKIMSSIKTKHNLPKEIPIPEKEIPDLLPNVEIPEEIPLNSEKEESPDCKLISWYTLFTVVAVIGFTRYVRRRR